HCPITHTTTGDQAMNSVLFQPFRLHDLTLPNRIVLSPMTRGRAGAARLPNRLMAEYYAQRSSAGLIVTEATTISEEANGWNESPGIYTDEMTEGWKLTTNAVHDKGGLIFLQLWHTGRSSHSSFHSGQPAVAPSAIKINEPDIHTPTGKQSHEVPRALETSEIPRVVADYRRAAERAKQAGFDGVHLSPNSPYNDMGSPDYREQFTFVAGQLDRFGLAYLHVVDGLAFGSHNLGEPMTLAEFRKAFHGPLIGNCGYTRETAEKAIAEGHADLISFGRPFISNPDLVERFKNGWALADPAPMSDWSSPSGGKGYTDFPAYAPQHHG